MRKRKKEIHQKEHTSLSSTTTTKTHTNILLLFFFPPTQFYVKNYRYSVYGLIYDKMYFCTTSKAVHHAGSIQDGGIMCTQAHIGHHIGHIVTSEDLWHIITAASILGFWAQFLP